MDEAANDPLLMVVKCRGMAKAAGGEAAVIEEGNLVHWRAGEFHAKHAGDAGLVALVLEADDMVLTA